MFATIAAQLRLAASIGFGRRFSRWSLDGVIDGILAAQREFGSAGPDARDVLAGPRLDEDSIRELQLRRFRTQVGRALETEYYRNCLSALGLDPARLELEDLVRVPLTVKEALRANPEQFVRPDASPCFRTTTTGTTGAPTTVYFSAYELQTYFRLAAMTFLVSGHIDASDVVQISTSSRATLGNTCFAGACGRIGAVIFLAGLIEPDDALALLAREQRVPGKKPKVSCLNTYPSYLGALIERGLQLGYRAADFGLERIVVGGELLSAGLRRRAHELFGPVAFEESYGMTETWPLTGIPCSEGHVHFDPGQGLVEVVDPETGMSAAPGQVGTIVATPFPPYRETTILLRYDTEDVVRRLEGQPSCHLRHLPATTCLLGKRRVAVRHERGWTFPRDVLDALESLDDVPLPARYGMRAVGDGVAVEVVVRRRTERVRRAVERGLGEAGVPLETLVVVEHPDELEHAVPLRCDLRELGFHTRARTGVARSGAVSGPRE